MLLQELFEGVTGYHGTDQVFRAFKMDRNASHPSKIGVWFASTPEAADVIGKQSASRFAGHKPVRVTARLHIENPKRYDTYGDFLTDFRMVGDASKMRKLLLRQGFDAVEITNSDTDRAGLRTDWAVFDPRKISITRTE